MSDPASQPANPFAPPKAEVADIADSRKFDLAGRGTRLGAVVLDTIISALLIDTPFFVALMVTWGPSGYRRLPGLSIGEMLSAGSLALAAMLAGLIAWTWITVVLVRRNGQTIGKKMLGIKVTRADGSKASLGRIFWLRNVVNAVLTLIPFLGFIYLLVDTLMIFGESRQCIHDRIADTIVVRA
jgi:uncharacterized RDD family membrane protein YckC